LPIFNQDARLPHSVTESKSTVTMEATTPENLVMDIDVAQGGARGKVHVTTKGRWLGASCTGIKNAS
jgi:hypothetical protein